MGAHSSNLVAVKTGDKQVEMAESPIPEPGEGEIIVRTTLSTICGSDMHIVDEYPFNPAMVPQGMSGIPLGHESVGIVHSVGEGVRDLKVGQRVIASCLTCCGRCRQCLMGDTSACTGGGGILSGAQGRYFRVKFADVSCAPIPDELSDEQILLATDIVSTAFGAVERGEVKMGDTVAVFAQGPVGLCATAGARARGAGLIIGVESVPARKAMSKKMGANIVVDPTEGDPAEAIMRLTNGQGVDVAIEAVGKEATWLGATNSIRKGGTVSSVGVYSLMPAVPIPTGTPTFFHRKFAFTLCPVGRDRMTQMMNMIRYGSVDLTPLLTHRFALEDAPKAYELFRSREQGVLKVALTP